MSAWLPEIFLALMGLAMLAYVVLDGFDLGVGILLPGGDEAQKDTMIASIGPFWDANETWLVLGVGILLIAFPMAHGVILSSLYLPVTIMLIALILRGVAFDFRVKARAKHKHLWDRSFFAGSALAALSQGFMLGAYILGFKWSVANFAFASFIGVCLLAGYALLGATWLLMKAEGELQRKAVRWAQRALWLTGIGIGAVSVATPMVSARIFEKWFSLPNFILLLQIPLITAALFASEHGPFWEVGLLTGVIYGLWMVKTKRLGDLFLAHGVTNLCLSLFTIWTGRWEYWM
jgi:cytochrome d ubiquinol oxidase subunit II